MKSQVGLDRAPPRPSSLWLATSAGVSAQSAGEDGASGTGPGAGLRRAAAGRQCVLDTGEDAFDHAEGTAERCCAAHWWRALSLQAAAYLVYAGGLPAAPRRGWSQKAFGPSYASLVTLTRKLVQVQRAAREAQVGPGHCRPSRPSGCARCCWLSRGICGWCCCAWPRGCRPCAGMPPSKQGCPAGAWRRESRPGLCAARQSPGHLAVQVGAGGPGLSLPAARGIQAHCQACWPKSALSARREWKRCGKQDGALICKAHGIPAVVLWPAQAHLQHLEKDAGQATRPSTG